MTTESAIPNEIPVLDLSMQGNVMDAAGVLGRGLEEFGFVIAVNHGIPTVVLDRAYDVAQRTFALAADVKRKYEHPEDGRDTGYASFGVEHAKDDSTPDLKEFWHVRKHVPAENLRFPKEIEDFGAVCLDLVDRLDEVSNHLLFLLERHLGLPLSTLIGMTRNGNSLLRLLHYPELLGNERGLRAGAHEDINLITLLVSATAAGLEVQTRDGRWIPVNNTPNAIIVNAGDMLQMYTDGRIRSTPHRVVNGDGRVRYSIPYFVHPRSDVLLRADPPLTAREYLTQRLREIGILA